MSEPSYQNAMAVYVAALTALRNGDGQAGATAGRMLGELSHAELAIVAVNALEFTASLLAVIEPLMPGKAEQLLKDMGALVAGAPS